MRNFYTLKFSVFTALLLTGCDYNRPGDYTPQAEYQAFLERKEEQARASEQGGAAALDPAQEKLAEGKRLFGLYCASCHGPDGRSDTPTAKAMRPVPRNFTDKAWQESVSDEHIATVIRDGGAAVGLSATMTPWGSALNAEQIETMVQVVRDLGK
ncbi:MAG: c-type cytochrome [Oligoflexus sp.]